ncbi:hypothetical protein [Streptomyces sp. NPDC005322]|uniref:hypothetical protein n=1 Tax=Streptomyces sp. NPDC005322 TaxID=3157032 RepID=UPI00339DD3BC
MTRARTLLDRLRNDPRAAELATHPFDFDVDTGDHHVEPVRLASGAPLEGIAGDAGGGTYFLCGDDGGEDRPVLFADSEGSAGVIGTNLTEALQLMIGLPCWDEALYRERQLGRELDEPELEALRAADDAEFIEDLELEDFPGMRAELLQRLGLAPLPPLTRLLERGRAAVALDPDHVLLNEEGDAYQQG